VAELCDRVLWLDRGHQRLTGDPRRVIDAYRQAVAEEEGAEHLAAARANQEEAAGEVLRWGSGQAEITTVRLLGPDGSERYHLQSGDRAVFEIHARAARPLTDFVFGIAVNTPRGFECWGTNTDLAGFVPGELAGEVVVRVTCPALRLAPGEYSVDVAIHRRDGAPYDYRRRAIGFTVTAATGGVGVYFPEHRWEFTGGVSWGSAAGRSPRSEP
jgi:hypothetical protein